MEALNTITIRNTIVGVQITFTDIHGRSRTTCPRTTVQLAAHEAERLLLSEDSSSWLTTLQGAK